MKDGGGRRVFRSWKEFGQRVCLIHKVQEISGNVTKKSGNEFRTVKLGQKRKEGSGEWRKAGK